MKRMRQSNGFTIVELLIVIVVIAILAAIVIVSYQGIVGQANGATIKSDLRNTSVKIAQYKATQGAYPTSLSSDLQVSGSDTVLSYSWKNDSEFCLSGSSAKTTFTFFVTQEGSVKEGDCPPVYIQTITSTACSTSQTLVGDARDNRTYWIKKLSDGKCWMLTNLAYAGGGNATYNDVKTLQNGSSDTVPTYTAPKYYAHSNANPTNNPSNPSTSIDGGATSAQYGYHYNWCAANGAQTATSTCMNALTPAASNTTSICPANWRLPTHTELQALNSSINSGSTSSDAGLRTSAFAQRSGIWNASFVNQANNGYYWSSEQYSASNAYMLSHSASFAGVVNTNKERAISVRCVAV